MTILSRLWPERFEISHRTVLYRKQKTKKKHCVTFHQVDQTKRWVICHCQSRFITNNRSIINTENRFDGFVCLSIELSTIFQPFKTFFYVKISILVFLIKTWSSDRFNRIDAEIRCNGFNGQQIKWNICLIFRTKHISTHVEHENLNGKMLWKLHSKLIN